MHADDRIELCVTQPSKAYGGERSRDRQGRGVGRSADAARKSACATSCAAVAVKIQASLHLAFYLRVAGRARYLNRLSRRSNGILETPGRRIRHGQRFEVARNLIVSRSASMGGKVYRSIRVTPGFRAEGS